MRRARGFSGLEIIGILVAIAALVAAITIGVKVVTSYLDDVRTTAFKAGEDKKDGEYKARDNEQLAAAHKEIVGLLLRNQALERQLAESNRVIQAKLRKEKEDAERQKTTTLARLVSGDLRLRDGIVEVGSCTALDGAGRAAQAGGAVPGALGPTCARFSRATEEFLVGEAARADAVTLERNACVAIALNDRKVINGLTIAPAGTSVGPPVVKQP